MYVRIVYDTHTKRMRARAEVGGWVRFPKRLRVHGMLYRVEELKAGKAGSWITKGKIQAV